MSEEECICFWDEKPWTYYGAVEPGGSAEPNYDCSVHFPSKGSK